MLCSIRKLTVVASAVAGVTLASSAFASPLTEVVNLNLSSLNDSTSGPTSLQTSVSVGNNADFVFTHTTDRNTGSGDTKTDYNGKLTLDAADQAQFLQIVVDADNQLADGTMNPIENYAEALLPGAVVGPDSFFLNLNDSNYDDRLLDSTGTGNGGAFSVASGERDPASESLFIGFAFGDAANPTYGYFEFINVDNDDSGFPGGADLNAATLYAITTESQPGVPLTVVSAVPEPTTIAAIGMMGGALLRRRRAV